MNRMSIKEIAALARERAKKKLETYVRRHAGFSGVRLDQAKMNMIAEYHSAFWDEMVLKSKEHFPTKESGQSLDVLLLELYKRGVTVHPLNLSLDAYRVEIGDTNFGLRVRNGVIYVGEFFSPEKKIDLAEDVIADLMVTYARESYPLPEIYEDVCRSLLLEKKEQELLASTASGLVHDILKAHKAVLNLEGIELKFTLTKGNIAKKFYSCLGFLREDLNRILKDIQCHEDNMASKSTDTDET